MFRRKDGRWQDKLPYKDENGKTKYKYFYGKTQADVRKQMREWKPEKPKPLMFGDVLEEWYAQKIEKVSYKTAEGYVAPVRRVKQKFGNIPLVDVTSAQIQAFINDFAKQGYKKSTVQRPLNIMRMVFNYAILKHGLLFNPCSVVSLPADLTQGHRELAAPEDIQIIKNSLSVPFGLFAYLLIYSGLRKGEALALTRQDIDEKNISVSKAVSWQTNKPVIKAPKTETSIRKVPVLAPLKRALPADWTGYLFSADEGLSPLTRAQFNKRWAAYCKTCGLSDQVEVSRRSKGNNNRIYVTTKWKPRLVPHQLRHEFATICYDAGIEAKDAQELLGHATLDTTMSIYTHIRQSRRESNVQKLNDYVDNAG